MRTRPQRPGDADEIEAPRAKIAAHHGVEVRYHGANMLKADEIVDMVATTERAGRLDILMNNAGIQHVSPVEISVEKWDAIIAINPSSVFHGARVAIPIMKRHKGRIVNLASPTALSPPVQIRLCRGQTRRNGLYQDPGPGSGRRRHHL